MNDALAVSGPVTSGTRGGPWSAPGQDLDSLGYAMEEFFIEGNAAKYTLEGDSYTTDGRWPVTEGGKSGYRTRILVVRPKQSRDFNGTVLACWLNVTAGFEYDTITSIEVFSGYAWVAVSAQRVGLEGFPEGHEYTGRQLPQDPLKKWDPQRYGSLHHPGDEYSFDIYTQAARALKSAPELVGGMQVQKVVAVGQSQSALRLTTYINAVQPLENVFDGFVLTLTPGWAVPLDDTPSMFETHVRDDLPVPIMIVNSEWEAPMMLSVRCEDSDSFRFWEVAGAPHTVAESGKVAPRTDGRAENPLTMTPVVSAAYRAMHRWLASGRQPPRVPRIRFDSEDPPVIARDTWGNALGGLRLPELEAPVAEYHGRDEEADSVLQSLYGWSRPFDASELAALYASDEEYHSSYREAIAQLIAEELLLLPDARERPIPSITLRRS